ncbi:MAG: UDP-glucose/GDP-mannose dehydrogenase family protein [Candidatus Magasanikbacteria bacterium GW2011_GWA2_56_11]|uniref:UDP-glucose/GDP-mannose dehydrogenase family protein n=1 Tax=Candidatus Magasanikbacteria bacterium GW2011_GWA2_56_11 TaxID=1619044 RepID=A0A0G1YG15_9BACT|nr:MAG: UDP-glucose/GDP-mannose dehydrogenase family protein [Candidatus Magasanikbacteria bacterium GW2011_GWA2_56_11]
MLTFEQLNNREAKIAVVGLGYVGLPLAVLLAKKFAVIGFDIDQRKIAELKSGLDRTGEVGTEGIRASEMTFSDDPAVLREARFLILAIPTPIDENKRPDLKLLERASAMIGKHLQKDSVVVYESTVYPGVTEDICLPIIERESGLKGGVDFKVAYSPERVNPGDKEHRIENVVKIVSGMDTETLDLVDRVYGSITSAGTYRAASIRVAEAAKAIENVQRDLNVALVNELAVIFELLGLSVYDVLEAAGTKWNFLKFKPGLVGGHCIGVDPYYLTFKAESLGYQPEVILAGRRINDSMGRYVAERTVKRMARLNKVASHSRVAILGFTFKENIPDVRNTRVIDIYRELQAYGLEPIVYDPHASAEAVREEYGIELAAWEDIKQVDTLIIAVAHDTFCRLRSDEYRALMNTDRLLIVDVKRILRASEVAALGIDYLTL